MRRTTVQILATFVVFAQAHVLAQTPGSEEMAVSIANTAEMLAKEGDYDGAIRLFQKAYDMARDPVLLYNIAFIHDKRGELTKAREFYERYLREEKDPQGQARGRQKLEALLDRIPGKLTLTTEPAGALVSLDGVQVGRAPVTINAVKRGAHQVSCRSEGYEPMVQTVTVLPGEETKVSLFLKPTPVELTIVCDCQGSRVDLDGNPLGTGPLKKSVKVMPGKHVIAVVPELGDGVVRTVEVGIGKPALFEVKLRPNEVLARTAEGLARDGDIEGAIQFYRKAYETTPEPRIFFEIGQLYERKGDLLQARASYERYLKEEKDPTGQTRGKAVLEALLDRIPGKLVVTTEPKGAVVELDGTKVGKAPFTKELKRGPHEVKAYLEGHEPASATVTISAGEEARAALVLKPVKVAQEKTLATTPPVSAPTPGAAAAQSEVEEPKGTQQLAKETPVTSPSMEGAPGPEPATMETVVKRSATRFPWHFVAVGAGAALVVAGGVMTGLANRDRDKIANADTEDGVTLMTRTEALSLRSSAKGKDTVSYVLYGVGGAAVAAGVVLWVLDVTRGPGSSDKSLALAVTSDGWVFGACGHF